MQLENVFQRNGYSKDGLPLLSEGIYRPENAAKDLLPGQPIKYDLSPGQVNFTTGPVAGEELSKVLVQLKAETGQVSRKAETYDDGKSPLANVPWEAVEAMAKVQAYGHKKYKDFNNYRKGMEVMRNLSCALRHIKSWIEGQDTDPESNESHLAHAMTRVAFTLQNIADGTAIDDRYKSKGAP